MRKKVITTILAAAFVVGLAPVANAGPGGAVCRAAANAYERLTGDTPWNCTA